VLTIHVLQVAHGDSIIVEYDSSSGRYFGVIDSNQIPDGDPPGLTKLRSLGAKELSFAAITHPHADHYKGFLKILQAYAGKIGGFYTFPIDRQRRLKQLAKLYQKMISETDSKTVRGNLMELIKILHFAKENIGFDNWTEPNGHLSQITPIGFNDVQIYVIMPHSRVKGTYFQLIEKGRFDIVESKTENDVSMAFYISYGGRSVVLGGDGTESNWMYRKRAFTYLGGPELSGEAVKLPHHGAKDDCSQKVINYLFRTDGDRFALISANGLSHPHPEVLACLKELNIRPYCTCLTQGCRRRMADILEFSDKIEPELLHFINGVLATDTDALSRPCQGDIQIKISASGSMDIVPENPIHCAHRGDLDFLLT
jgi:beta-lactamase superfamily II metal-dependent hydrolase